MVDIQSGNAGGKPIHGSGSGHGEKRAAHFEAEKTDHVVDRACADGHHQIAVCRHVNDQFTKGCLVESRMCQLNELCFGAGGLQKLQAPLAGNLIRRCVTD